MFSSFVIKFILDDSWYSPILLLHPLNKFAKSAGRASHIVLDMLFVTCKSLGRFLLLIKNFSISFSISVILYMLFHLAQSIHKYI